MQPAATRSLSHDEIGAAQVELRAPLCARSRKGSEGWLSTGAITYRIDHEGEREVVRQAHADGAHALAAGSSLVDRLPAERAQPDR